MKENRILVLCWVTTGHLGPCGKTSWDLLP